MEFDTRYLDLEFQAFDKNQTELAMCVPALLEEFAEGSQAEAKSELKKDFRHGLVLSTVHVGGGLGRTPHAVR